jgi:DNA-binding transcriptional LysR family regulator
MIKHPPEIELKVEISDSLKVFEGVRRGQCEIGIIGTRFDSPEVEYTVIVKDDRLVLIIPKNHPLAAKATVSLSDLKGHSFVHTGKGLRARAAYEKAFRDAGLALTDLNTVAETGTTEGIIQRMQGKCSP